MSVCFIHGICNKKKIYIFGYYPDDRTRINFSDDSCSQKLQKKKEKETRETENNIKELLFSSKIILY